MKKKKKKRPNKNVGFPVKITWNFDKYDKLIRTFFRGKTNSQQVTYMMLINIRLVPTISKIFESIRLSETEHFLFGLMEIRNRHIPSQPTASRGGTLCWLMNFSSITIWVPAIIWAMIINKSPGKKNNLLNSIFL